MLGSLNKKKKKLRSQKETVKSKKRLEDFKILVGGTVSFFCLPLK